MNHSQTKKKTVAYNKLIKIRKKKSWNIQIQSNGLAVYVCLYVYDIVLIDNQFWVQFENKAKPIR